MSVDHHFNCLHHLVFTLHGRKLIYVEINLVRTLNEWEMFSLYAQEPRVQLSSKTIADVSSGRWQAHHNLLALAGLACFHRLA